MNDWQPIESAPKDGTPFLGAFKDTGGWKILIFVWSRSYSRFLDSGDAEVIEDYDQPTHWMPLPEPPK